MRLILLSVIWFSSRTIFAQEVNLPRSYDLCLGYSALSNGREAMAGEGYSIEAALNVCANQIEGCVAVSFDRIVAGQASQGRCRFFKSTIDPDHFVSSPTFKLEVEFPVIMNVRNNLTGLIQVKDTSSRLPSSCVVCTGDDCFPPTCPAGFSGQASGLCTSCPKGSWTTEGNVMNTCTPCTSRSCNPRTGTSTSAHSKVSAGFKIMMASASSLYQQDYSWLLVVLCWIFKTSLNTT